MLMEASAKSLILLGLFFALSSPVDSIKCWSTSGNVMNNLDITKPVLEENCGSQDKSCEAITYDVGGMWYVKMGCSPTDKDGCTTVMKGTTQEFNCFCKTDYCNGKNANLPDSLVLTFVVLVALWAKRTTFNV